MKVREGLPVTWMDLWYSISRALRDMLKWLSDSKACATPGLENRLKTMLLVPVLNKLPTSPVIMPNSKPIYAGLFGLSSVRWSLMYGNVHIAFQLKTADLICSLWKSVRFFSWLCTATSGNFNHWYKNSKTGLLFKKVFLPCYHRKYWFHIGLRNVLLILSE